MLAVGSRALAAEQANGVWQAQVCTTESGSGRHDTTIACELLINAAGLDAIALARKIEGLSGDHIPPMHFAKGNYARLNGRSPFSRLIYPVPVPGGLGTHLTIDMGGQAQFGPDVQWLDQPSQAQIERGLIEAFDYSVDASRLVRFERDIRTWWPGLPENALSVGYAGIRPKLVGPDEPAADFMVQGPRDHGLAGLVNLFGMESPGLTSCLAIAQEVRGLVE